MQPDPIPRAEEDSVQDFISKRQVDLLERAIAALRDCTDQELAAQAHRLSGTLGTYQLPDAARAVRDLYDLARTEPPLPLEERRSETIDMLVDCLNDLRSASEGAATP